MQGFILFDSPHITGKIEVMDDDGGGGGVYDDGGKTVA